MFYSPRCFRCDHRLGVRALWRCLLRPAGVSLLRVTLGGQLHACVGRWICARCEPRADRILRGRPQ